MKFGYSIVLLSLAMCALMPMAFSADYSAAESVVEDMLLNPEYNLRIESVDVSIDTDKVIFDCITDISVQETGAPLEQFGTFLGGVLGTYYQVVTAAPDAGDLVIIMKNKDQPTAPVTMTCSKNWIKNADLTSVNGANELIAKVFSTMEKA